MPYFRKQIIKVITGQRRVDKSFLPRQIKDELHKKHPGANIIYIDLEKFEFDNIKTYSDLHKYVKSKSRKGRNIIMIDEVQEVREFGNLLEIKDNYPKYVISMDSFPLTASMKGVKHITLMDFLMKE